MKKLKFDKKFQPVAVSLGDEMYRNGIFEFNITKLSEFLDKNQDKFLIEMLEVNGLEMFNSDNLDEKTINSASLAKPVILAEISPYQFNVIDGNHRIKKASRSNVTKVPAYKVYSGQHIKFLTSEQAYKAYIEYWNSKIKSLSANL